MPTPLERSKAQRQRISQYYDDGWQFLIRLLIGFGIYYSIRILLSGVLMRVLEISYDLSRMPVDVLVLLMSAFLTLAFLWLKGSRLHFAASAWMPVLLCLSIADWVRFALALFQHQYAEAFLGILPIVLFTTFFVLVWILYPKHDLSRISVSILLILLSVFWISDLPGSLRQVRNLQPLITEYQSFYTQLLHEHSIASDKAPSPRDNAGIITEWSYLPLCVSDYRIDPEFDPLRQLLYVREICIHLQGPRRQWLSSVEDLHFRELDKIRLYYFYKYSTRHSLCLRDFRFSGEVFFRAETVDGKVYYLDNVIVRRK